MRTTLTLDRDVAERIRQEVRRTGRSLKAIVNEALRQGLGGATLSRRSSRFVVKTFDLRLKPGVDPDRMNQLADELQVAEQLASFEVSKTEIPFRFGDIKLFVCRKTGDTARTGIKRSQLAGKRNGAPPALAGTPVRKAV